MAGDPFQILGVTKDASEDEIKSAYRKLARKYHPDLNPDSKAAEEKMSEINAAYDLALKIKRGEVPYGAQTGSSNYGQSGYGQSSYGQGGGSYYRQGGYQQQNQGGYDPFGFGGFGFDPFGGFGGAYGGRTTTSRKTYADATLQSAADYILTSRYREAVTVLERSGNRTADWYALYAQASYGMGNRVAALNSIKKAVQMEPGNREYQDLLDQIQRGSSSYRQTQESGSFMNALCANPCLTFLGLQCLCGGCCGGRMFCI